MTSADGTRRGFLRGLVALGAGAAALAADRTARAADESTPEGPALEPAPGLAEGERPRIRAYRPLGKLDFRMSDVSMGGAELGPTPVTYREALACGINYFDTAPDYFEGAGERVIGAALAEWKGRREDVWVTTKMCTTGPVTSHLPHDARKADFLAALRGSLDRLGLAHVDAWLLHALGGGPFHQDERFENPEMWAAVGEAKERGWVRAVGVSSHGPFHKLDRLTHAVESGRVDLILAAYSHLGGKGGTSVDAMRELFRKATGRGVAVVVMKTVPRASWSDEEHLRSALGITDSYAQLCLRWVLRTPEISGLVKSMRTVAEVRECVRASGAGLALDAAAALSQQAERISAAACRIGCGDCLGTCPAGVEIPTLLRYGSYYEDYGRERSAMERYRRVGGHGQVASCVGCAAPCRSACPYDLDVPGLLAHADRVLDWG